MAPISPPNTLAYPSPFGREKGKKKRKKWHPLTKKKVAGVPSATFPLHQAYYYSTFALQRLLFFPRSVSRKELSRQHRLCYLARPIKEWAG
ncbi:predicted protein [Uncinocarpus reesii 1704]|uniref:Uncharacterized protein n=1 Tax=Uncinocarpus reesii (strain UAMH 1704) TaxID=336963 RepID=C4JQZ6_UNCRE|nr:uncharacterized protein UREG_03478 [Uncinocarpus reesii 1704]EEP78632.1 predicted protein [Uncinocarpus reesii 1704]